MQSNRTNKKYLFCVSNDGADSVLEVFQSHNHMLVHHGVGKDYMRNNHCCTMYVDFNINNNHGK